MIGVVVSNCSVTGLKAIEIRTFRDLRLDHVLAQKRGPEGRNPLLTVNEDLLVGRSAAVFELRHRWTAR